jgi:hypothetical protein
LLRKETKGDGVLKRQVKLWKNLLADTAVAAFELAAATTAAAALEASGS